MKAWSFSLWIGVIVFAVPIQAQAVYCAPSSYLLPANMWSSGDGGFSSSGETKGQEPVAPTHAPPVRWAYSLTTDGYIVPGGPSYVSPDFTADRKWLHLEARYNNEALYTGSVWAGYNINAGKKVELSVTPMVGAVFGDLNGVAPGYLFTLTYKRLQASSDGELVFDLEHGGSSFFYCWNQVTYSPLTWMQVGIVTQRTRVYDTGLDVQRGVLVGFTHKNVNFTANIFNFGWTTPTEVLALGFTF